MSDSRWVIGYRLFGTACPVIVRVIGGRTADAMAEAKTRGVRFGRERMAPQEVVVDRIVAARSSGGSFSAIASALDRDGVPTPNGGQRWYPSTVNRIVAATTREVA